MDNQKYIKTSFWDFKNPKIYKNEREKVLDFIVGLIIGGGILHLTSDYFLAGLFSFKFEKLLSRAEGLGKELSAFPIWEILLVFAICILMALAVLYLWKRRKQFAIGLLIPLVIRIGAIILFFL